MADVNETTAPVACSYINEGMIETQAQLIIKHNLEIGGQFDGRITSSAKVKVLNTAKITADVVCDSFECSGQFEGNIYVKTTATFYKGCNFKGKVFAGKIGMEEGSTVDASVKTISEASFQKLTSEDKGLKSLSDKLKSGYASAVKKK